MLCAVVFEFLRPQENLTPDAGQNLGATKIPLPLRAGDKNTKTACHKSKVFILSHRLDSPVTLSHSQSRHWHCLSVSLCQCHSLTVTASRVTDTVTDTVLVTVSPCQGVYSVQP